MGRDVSLHFAVGQCVSVNPIVYKSQNPLARLNVGERNMNVPCIRIFIFVCHS